MFARCCGKRCRARAQRLEVDGNLGPNPRPHRMLGCSRCSALRVDARPVLALPALRRGWRVKSTGFAGRSCATSPGHYRAKVMEKREAATRKRFAPHGARKGLGRHREKSLDLEAGSTTCNVDGARRHGRSWPGGASQVGRLHDESHDCPEMCRHSRIPGCCRPSVCMGTRAERRR